MTPTFTVINDFIVFVFVTVIRFAKKALDEEKRHVMRMNHFHNLFKTRIVVGLFTSKAGRLSFALE